VVLLQVEDRDVGALLGEVHGHRAADAAVAAADDRDLAVQLAARPVVLALVARLGRHLPLVAGLLVLLLRWSLLFLLRHGGLLRVCRATLGTSRMGTMTGRCDGH